MRPCSPALAAYLAANDTVAVIDLYTFVLPSGAVLRYSGGSGGLTIPGTAFPPGGLNYDALGYTAFALGPRFGRSQVTTKIGVEPTELDVAVLAGAEDLVGNFSFADAVRTGQFDGATVGCAGIAEQFTVTKTQCHKAVRIGCRTRQQLPLALGQIDSQGVGEIRIGVGRQYGGKEALAAAAIRGPGKRVGGIVGRDRNLRPAPVRAAAGDDPYFRRAAAQRRRRLEHDRRVAVAGRDKRIERRPGAALPGIGRRGADSDRRDRAGHYGVTPGISSAVTVNSPLSFSSIAVMRTAAAERPSAASVTRTMSIGASKAYSSPA